MKPEDCVFSHTRGAIIANIASVYGMPENSGINYFMMAPKRCYNSDTKIKKDPKTNEDKVIIGFREHNTTYLNYFEKFYDRDHRLLYIYARLKYYIDYQEGYGEDNFINDLVRYLIDHMASPILHYNIGCMNRDNYNIHLSYRNNKNPCLEYTDYHAMILMEISMMQNIIIPLVSHYIYTRNVSPQEVKRILLRSFDRIFVMIVHKYNVDMISKLLETTFTNVNKSRNNNIVLFDMQDIRGRNPTVHSMYTLEDIIMQIIPKYTYSKNIIHFNFDAIMRDIKYKITDIPYEFALITVSSSNRDDDNNSESDKFEAHMAKQDEAMLIQTNVNCETTMRNIIQEFGPFSEEEIEFYRKELTIDGKPLKNEFQCNLISYIFLNNFCDTQAVKLINNRDYIILMIAAKRKLIREGQTLLPFVLGGRISRFVTRKTVNKKILQRMMLSDNFPKVVAKYRNEKIQEQILFKNIAQILASEFRNIDPYNDDLNGIKVECTPPEIICEEMLLFTLLI
jgi:hypothetical protein